MSDIESARADSFFDRGLSAPSYTRPPVFRGHAVPEVLLSGDHKKIAEWREAERRLSVAEPGSARADGSWRADGRHVGEHTGHARLAR